MKKYNYLLNLDLEENFLIYDKITARQWRKRRSRQMIKDIVRWIFTGEIVKDLIKTVGNLILKQK